MIFKRAINHRKLENMAWEFRTVLEIRSEKLREVQKLIKALTGLNQDPKTTVL
jgi:hypothetical protein